MIDKSETVACAALSRLLEAFMMRFYASGVRIIVTLVHALQRKDFKRVRACLCIWRREITALALEAV